MVVGAFLGASVWAGVCSLVAESLEVGAVVVGAFSGAFVSLAITAEGVDTGAISGMTIVLILSR